MKVGNLNMKDLGSLVITGILLFVGIAVVIHFISPLLITAGLITVKLTLTDTILFLVLLVMVTKTT
ncbi:MAG: hypothetical protein K0R63_644 [Rickettsiales bacterium]|jgi:hypothetical protein|nr:hypothetical protein [Rickettsiales bacterium]